MSIGKHQKTINNLVRRDIKIGFILFALFLLFSFGNKNEVISSTGEYKGITIGTSTIQDITNIFGNEYVKESKNLSVHFVDGNDANVIQTHIHYKSMGILFVFTGKELNDETVGKIIFLKKRKCVTDKGISIEKSRAKDVIEKYGEGYWNCGDFFSRKLTLSYDGIDFIFDKQISMDLLKTVDIKEFYQLKVLQIALRKLD